MQKGKGSPHMAKLRVMVFGRKRPLAWRLFWEFKRIKEARRGKDTGANEDLERNERIMGRVQRKTSTQSSPCSQEKGYKDNPDW